MFKNKIILIITMISLLFSRTVFCQTNDLTDQQKVDFKERTGQMIDRFQKNLEILGSKEKPIAVKSVYISQTLKLFIGQGEPYIDSFGNQKSAVTMQISTLRNGIQSIRTLPLIKYLNNLVRLPYAKVEITQAETFHLSELHKVGNQYQATAKIFQKFCGYSYIEGRLQKRYCDEITAKTIVIYIVPEEDMNDRGELVVNWTVKFGNIDVAETTGF